MFVCFRVGGRRRAFGRRRARARVRARSRFYAACSRARAREARGVVSRAID
jgi:hypothetical protein